MIIRNFFMVTRNFLAVTVVVSCISIMDSAYGMQQRMHKEQERINEELIEVAEKGDVGKVRKLIAQGAHVNYHEDFSYYSYLNLDVFTANAYEEVREKEKAIQGKAYGGTALMKAQSSEMVNVLLDAKADVHARCSFGVTPLLCPKNGVAIEALLASRADVNATDVFGRTPLMVCPNNEIAVKALLRAKADINARNSKGQTPLRSMVRKGKEIAVRELIYAGASVDEQDDRGNTLLYHATYLENYEKIIKMLIYAGLSPHRANNNYETFWTMANKKRKNVAQQALMVLEQAQNDGAYALVLGSSLEVGIVWSEMPTVIRELAAAYMETFSDFDEIVRYWKMRDAGAGFNRCGKRESVEKKNKAKKAGKHDCIVS